MVAASCGFALRSVSSIATGPVPRGPTIYIDVDVNVAVAVVADAATVVVVIVCGLLVNGHLSFFLLHVCVCIICA